MSTRRARVQKIVEHRSEQLDQAVAALAERRNQQAEAERALEAQRAQVTLASQAMDALGSKDASIDTWRMADDWLKTQIALEQKAQARVHAATLASEQARQGVVKARSDLRRVEALVTRIDRDERAQAERVERRAHDELAAQRFSRLEREREER